MLSRVFCVYDAQAEVFFPPYVAVTRGVAIRQFADMANKEGHQFNVHPDDYILYEVGSFDDSTGQVSMDSSNIRLGSARDFFNK